MLKKLDEPKIGFFVFWWSILAACLYCWAGEPGKYIGIDEIAPGMEAYCLTCYEGTKIEKFGLKVLSVVRDISPGRDAILVQGTDERFIHSGPVAGCSGSPVYIDGRLAGALAFGAYFSKDPLYGVTPIKEMLRVGQAGQAKQGSGQAGDAGPAFLFNFSRPIDFAEINEQIRTARLSRRRSPAGFTALPCPLVSSGLPDEAGERLNALVEPFGLMAVAGIGAGGAKSGNFENTEDVKLEPGACLTVPLVTGDISIEVLGTVTEVVDDKIYGFGHSFLGYGQIDLPMATGQIHAVFSNVFRSFKLGSALEVVGALTTDESAAIVGRIGTKAKMIPLKIKVSRYNDAEKRIYNCQLANNQLLTPLVLGPAVAGAALMMGNLPPEHTIEYKVSIDVKGFEPITFENVSTGVELEGLIRESVGSVAILMNNPYRKVDIESIDFDIRQMAKSIVSHIWSVDLGDSKVKAGEQIEISVVVESFLGGKKRYQCSLQVPDELAPGEYNLIVSGGHEYGEFLRKAAPYKFVPQNMESLIEAANNILSIKRDRLYCFLVLPPDGVAVEKAELPDLPATKALVLQDAKRTLRVQPYQHWLEESMKTQTVIIDKKVMSITVEK